MSKDDINRKDKMINDLLDTSADSITKWGNDYISANIPKAMNWTAAKIKEIVESLAKNSNTKSHDFIRNIICQGIEIGEDNKEYALILAMKKSGIDEGQISQIVENSKQYLMTIDGIDDK